MFGDKLTNDEDFLPARVLRVNSPYRIRAGTCACMHGLISNLTLSTLEPSMRHPGLGVENTLSVHYCIYKALR